MKVIHLPIGKGKTTRLLKYAKKNNCIVIAHSRQLIVDKALEIGIPTSDVGNYRDLLDGCFRGRRNGFVVDDLEEFFRAVLPSYVGVVAVSITKKTIQKATTKKIIKRSKKLIG